MTARPVSWRASWIALAVRALWGAVLVAKPDFVLERIGGPGHPGHPPIAVRVTRILGARHLLQCLLEAVGGRRAIRVGVVVDLIHAGTDVGFATLDERWRSAALADASITAGFVALGLPQSRTSGITASHLGTSSKRRLI